VNISPEIVTTVPPLTLPEEGETLRTTGMAKREEERKSERTAVAARRIHAVIA
jgi:hypothetical protein